VVEQPHGDRGLTELEYRLAWARTYLKKYGLLDNSSRAIWSLTPKGLETKAVEPQEVVKAVRAMSAERKASKEAEGSGERDIITTSGFMRDARQEATRDGATAIDLIDGEMLADKLKELSLGVRTKMVEAVEIDDDWFASV
jgi:restriction endonuclease Mrr